MTLMTYVVKIYQRKKLETLRNSVLGKREGDKDDQNLNPGRAAILRRLKKSTGCTK